MGTAWKFKHTEQTDAVIRSGYAANAPVSAIAAELKTTRNTVIGRANRIGLSRPWRTSLGYSNFLADAARRELASAAIVTAQRQRRQREKAPPIHEDA